MDIKQLEYFVTVVNEGSISAASRKLYMSQPPLSSQMKQLEQQLNCKLFERGARTITLTPQGQLLYAKANQILDMVDETMLEVNALNNQTHLRIGLISSVIDYFSEILSTYCLMKEDVILEVKEANTYQIIDLLNEGEIDLAIVRTPYPPLHQMEEVKLLEDHLVAVGKGLPDEVTLEYLSRQPLVVYRRWQSIIAREFENSNLEFNYHCLNDDARTSLTFVDKGMGIGLVPFSSTMADNDLEVKEIKDCLLASDVNLIYPAHSTVNRQFIEYIQANVKTNN